MLADTSTAPQAMYPQVAGDKSRPTDHGTRGDTPQGLNAVQWRDIQRQIESRRFHVRVPEQPAGSYHATNHTLGLEVQYDADGVTRVQASGDRRARAGDNASLRLTAIGYHQLIPVGQPLERVAEGGRLTYRWTQNLSEWWINQPGRLEQWFRVETRPVGADDTSSQQPLRLAMALQTELTPVMTDQQLNLRDDRGATRLRYDRLKVWDARGRVLPARMSLDGRTLILAIDDRHAHYPIMIDPSWTQQAYLKASNTGNQDTFGYSVALSGDTLVIGAPQEDGDGTGPANDDMSGSGAVYVFVRDGNSWRQQAYLKADSPNEGDQFGTSVAVDGNTIVVGAQYNDDIGALNAGAAYVFVRDVGSGAWSQQAMLNGGYHSGENDRFGFAVAISGDAIVVGAIYEDGDGTDPATNNVQDAGAAYVFEREDNAWRQKAYLKAPAPTVEAYFGTSVTISGSTLLVGEHRGEGPGQVFSGTAHVFVRDGQTGNWESQGKLVASDAATGDRFGTAVALSGDTAVVGATQRFVGKTGTAYVFARDGAGNWTQQEKLIAGNLGPEDQFGQSVAISGDTVVVGAPLADNSTGAGAAYVFVRDGANWSQPVYLKADQGELNDYFGWAVAISRGTVVVGARWEDSASTGVHTAGQADDGATNAGAVYVFEAELTSHTVTPGVSATGGGSIDPAVPQTVVAGQSFSFTLEPDSGMVIDSVGGNCGGTLEGQIYTTNAITADCTVVASFISAVEPVDGACGSADGVAVATKPIANLCNAGDAAAVIGTGSSWDWTCAGLHGGATSSCSAPLLLPDAPVRHADIPSPAGSGTVTVDLTTMDGGPQCGFIGVPTMLAAIPGASPAVPPGVVFPQGLLSFQVSNCTPGSTITLTLKLPAAVPDTATYWKWGPTPDQVTPHWYQLPASFNGDTVTFSITDGGLGDGDLDDTNGTIVDPGGPGVAEIPVAIAPAITSRAPPGGALGVSYGFTVTATGTAPLSFSATGLPAGLSIDASTGIISGTPSAAGTYDIAITVSNAAGSAKQAAQMVMAAQPAATPIPTLSQWVLMLLGLLTAGAGAPGLRRRSCRL